METLHPNPQGHQPPLNRNIGGIPLSEHLPPVTEGLLSFVVSILKGNIVCCIITINLLFGFLVSPYR